MKIIVAVLLICTLCKAKDSYTLEEQQDLVDLHNHLRSIVSPTASNMRKLEYSSDLAASAQAWADGCVWAHGTGDVTQRTYKTFGQNLFAGTGTFNLNQSVVNWDSEKKDYTYSTRDCSAVCGHYTQVVWALSTKLGCGVKQCATMQNLAFTNAYYVVCHYHIPGNLVKDGKVLHPYESGASCSSCPPEASVCHNNLCSTGGTGNSTDDVTTRASQITDAITTKTTPTTTTVKMSSGVCGSATFSGLLLLLAILFQL